jgi:hypothetical protein
MSHSTLVDLREVHGYEGHVHHERGSIRLEECTDALVLVNLAYTVKNTSIGRVYYLRMCTA